MRNGLSVNARPGLLLICLTIVAGGCDGSHEFARVEFQRGTPSSRPAALEIGPPRMSIATGASGQLTATSVQADGSRRDVSTEVSWSSANPAVASIGNAPGAPGLVSANSPGSTTITASLTGMSASVPVNVTPATLASISVTPASPALARGTSRQLIATGLYSDNTTLDLTAAAAWSSSDSNVAAVSNVAGSSGQAQALTPGVTTVTATFAGVSGSTTLTVTAATLVSIEVTPPTQSLARGLSTQLTATGVYTDLSTQDLTEAAAWSSSNAAVASVSTAPGQRGLATTSTNGTTMVVASVGNIHGTANLTVTDAALLSISVTPASPGVASGLTTPFTATGTYSDHSTRDLTSSAIWTSSDTFVMTMSNALGHEGLGSALNAGTASITATVGTVSGSAAVTVTNAALVSIGITPAAPTIANGLTRQFTATGVYTDLSTLDLTDTVAWTSSDTSVATISNANGSRGLASSADTGTTTITAALGTVTGSTTLTVTAATLVSISVTPDAGPLNLGYNRQFTATGTYTDHSTQDLTSAVTWTSSAPSIASISNAPGTRGMVSSLAQGTAEIGATLGGVTATGLSLVVAPPAVVGIVVTPAGTSIAIGTTLQFVGSFLYSDNSTTDETANLTWDSSDNAVATVSNTNPIGRATGVVPGTVTITASAPGVPPGSTTLDITAAALVSIAVTPSSVSIANGTQRQFTATGTYTDSSTQNLTAAVTWNSSNTAVASISNAGGSNGLATSAGPGSTSITASLAGVTSPAATLTVNAGTAYAYVLNQDDDSIL